MIDNIDIIKASGEKEKFNKEKLYQSLRKAGAEPKLAKRVCHQVIKNLWPGINTDEILNLTIGCLRKENPVLATRYNLKRAIMELGPTGFPFERYVAEILKEYGYRVKIGEIVPGYCVNHEIDVIAQKEEEHFMVECKYHNTPGLRSDVKVALYTHARFLDVKRAWEEIKGDETMFHQAWLVTNTKCTSQAINYARCVGLKIISWHYPKNGSLEYLIENKGLYPITILTPLTKQIRERLAQQNFILAKDLLKYSIDDLVKLTGIKPSIAKEFQQEVKEVSLINKTYK